jgi:hypothetical protein
VGAMPQGGSGGRIKGKVIKGTSSSAPAFAGMPPGDHRTIVSSVPTLPLTAEPMVGPAAPVAPGTEIATAEPVAAMRPLPDSQPIGLLALVAMVCVLGVTAGTIRAFVSQRAYRAMIA